MCLFQPEQRLLISGDHLLGRVSLYYDYGWTEDPTGEFIGSLDTVEALDARLCLPGHGRTFTDVQGHIDANRRAVAERIEKVLGVISRDPITAFDAVPLVYDGPGDADQRPVVAVRDALLPASPRGDRPRAAPACRWP